MSTHNNLYTSTADVNATLEDLGSATKLNRDQKALHAEFRVLHGRALSGGTRFFLGLRCSSV